MANSPDLHLDRHPALAEAASRIFFAAATCERSVDLFPQVLPAIRQAVGAEFAAVVHGEKGHWRTLAATGPDRAFPAALPADALDRDELQTAGDWAAAPLPQGAGEVLLLHRPWPHAGEPRGDASVLTAWLAQARSTVRRRERETRRGERLQLLLDLAAQWRKTLQMEALLQRLAEAATKLLDAERATIFLWDRDKKTLVGRPALGVEGGELRVPDDAGVVGQVVQTGETRRVDADIAADQREVDRSVDRKLKFQTKSLICVPLDAPGGERLGAFEVLNKLRGNFTADDEEALRDLAEHAAVALETTRQFEAVLHAHEQATEAAAAQAQMIGECPQIQALRSTIQRVAGTDLAVLILGENGTGKEVVSQMVHYLGKRRREPFVAVNCAAIPDTLLESELFGHEKGAFTDAREARPGKFELAARGTLFLDEIGDMSMGGQAKLLRVLEEKVVVRVGGSRLISTDARVIAATNQNLAELVRQKKFREDLFFRLNVVTLEIPALRNRGDDVVLLAEHFLRIFAARSTRRHPPKLTAAGKKRLREHLWPGNVRELRNLMERVTFLLPDEQDQLDAADLQFALAPERGGEVLELDLPLTEATHRFQIEYIRRQIDHARGNMTTAAERMGLHRSNLYRKMSQLGMETS